MTKVLRTGTHPLLAVVAMLSVSLLSTTAQGQSDDLIAVNTKASNTSIDSSLYGDKFKEAERALLEGLSAGDPAPVQPVAAMQPVKAQPIVERVDVVPPPTKPRREVPSAPALKPSAPAKSTTAKVVTADRKSAPQAGAVSVLQNKLTSSELRVGELEQQLSEAKSQLSAAEVEINRLSGIISGGSRARLAPRAADTSARLAPSQASNETASRQTDRSASAALTESRQVVADVAPPPPSQNLQVATVAVDKAELRLGPGKNHSALMTIPRGSRLAVEVRQGEWYRVFAPSGERAWIQSGLVRFGDGAASLNDGSSVKVRGYDSSVEQQAFRRANALTGGR